MLNLKQIVKGKCIDLSFEGKGVVRINNDMVFCDGLFIGEEADIEITRCYFPTRQYGGITLPAGEYNALRVILGEGEGENWWCVMFPPMCLPAAGEDEKKLSDVLNEKSMDIVSKSQKYEVRLWIVEKWYELWSR